MSAGVHETMQDEDFSPNRSAEFQEMLNQIRNELTELREEVRRCSEELERVAGEETPPVYFS